MLPKTLDLLDNFGKRTEHAQDQDISSAMPPKTMDLLENFGGRTEHGHNQGDHHSGTPSRSRSRSPSAISRTSPTVPPHSEILGYSLDQLGLIQIIPFKNPQRKFELRRFTFPLNKPIELLEGQNRYGPIPTQEHIVLSTPDGDVFAMMKSNNTLVGLYAYNPYIGTKGRCKFNMNSGKLMSLTPEEIKETPVGPKRQFSNGYKVENVNHSHECMTLPTRLLSSDGSGYELEQLQYIQLIPNKNPNQLFGLRRYTFPADKDILWCQGARRFGPPPIQELIVLTTLLGDVFAILASSSESSGIYTYNSGTRSRVRVKINMMSSTITPLTKHEVEEVPVGRLRPIQLYFKIHHVDRNFQLH